jgi:hypothetical protein
MGMRQLLRGLTGVLCTPHGQQIQAHVREGIPQIGDAHS